LSALKTIVDRVVPVLRWLALAAVVLVGLLICLIVGLFMWIDRGSQTNVYVFPHRDRQVSLVSSIRYAGVPIDISNDLHLAGGSFERKVWIGTYFDGGWSKANGWVDPRTVNLCDLRYDDAKARVSIFGGDGVARTYRILRECPPGYFESDDPAKSEVAG
jgi:hypothetical protein